VEGTQLDAFRGELLDGRMPAGAHVPVRNVLERAASRRQHEVDAGRPQSDHDDSGGHGQGLAVGGTVGVGLDGGVVVGVGPRAPRGGTTAPRPFRTTQRPYRGSTSTLAFATTSLS